MTPHTSYWIWFSPRTGSTLLCELLASTGIAGQPGEHFNVEAEKGIGLAQQYQVDTYPELRQKIWDLGTSPNGVFGVKSSLFNSRWEPQCAEVLSLLAEGPQYQERVGPRTRTGMSTATPPPAEVNINSFQNVWGDLFPNCKHIYLTRRNKIRQAVSWWKAIKNESWHLREGQTQKDELAFYEEHYNFDALTHLLKEIALREAATQAYFSVNGIQPLNLVYEDFIQDMDGTVEQILGYIGKGAGELASMQAPLQRTATANSEIWVQRFREDLQRGWDNRAW